MNRKQPRSRQIVDLSHTPVHVSSLVVCMHLDVLPKTIDSVRGVSSDCICFSSDVGLPLLVAFLFPMMMQTNRKFPALMISAADHCVWYVVCQWKQSRSVSTLRLSGSDPLNPSIHWNTTLKRSPFSSPVQCLCSCSPATAYYFASFFDFLR